MFLALPHGASAPIAADLGDDVLVIDIAADHRLVDAAIWQQFYGTDHPGTWPYGLPELSHVDGRKQREELMGVKRVAAPGCYPTAVSLALAPGLAAGLLQPEDIVVVAASGTSGAGKALKPHLLAAEAMGAMSPYGVGGSHRHTPEIQQNLACAAGVDVTVVERSGIAAGSSWGNAGWISPGLAVPLSDPSVIKYGLKAVLDPDSPLYLPLTPDPQLVRFLVGFARRCTTGQWKRTMATFVPLNQRAIGAYDTLERGGVQATSHEAPIVAAFKNPDDAAGLEHARAAGIPTQIVRLAEHPDRSRWDTALADAVAAHHPQLVVLAGFMKLIGPALLDAFGGRIVNTHPALLPSFPGAHGVRDALAHGVKVTGCSVIEVDAGVDTGRILAQAAVPVLDTDTEAELHERIKVQERALLLRVLGELSRR